MSALSATARREIVHAFVSGRAWFLAIGTAALTGLPLVAHASAQTGIADFAPSFSVGAWCVLIGAAILGAASVSAERRYGTWDLILASPARPADSIWAKWMAMAVTLCIVLIGFPLQAIIESLRSSVDWASIVSGVAGLWLMGMAAGSIGLVAGAIVRSSVGATATAILLVTGWVLLTRSMQVFSDPWNAAVGFALDPIRRAQECSNGVIDFGTMGTLVGTSVGFAWLAARWVDAERRCTMTDSLQRRIAALTLSLAAIVAVGLSMRGPGSMPPSVDFHQFIQGKPSETLRAALTKTEGPIHFSLLAARGLGEPATAAARQAVKRAKACVDASGSHPTLQELDMLSPLQAGEIALAMDRIAASESTLTRSWRERFDAALKVLQSICSRSDLSVPLSEAAARTANSPAVSQVLQSLAAALQRAGAEGGQWQKAFEASASSTVENPFGDVEGSSRALAMECGVWAKLLQAGADVVSKSGSRKEQREISRALAGLADAARLSQDSIDRLPPLRLTEVAAALHAPPVVVVTSPQGCAAIPAWRLLEGAELADAALAETIAASQGGERQTVVFVHGWKRSPFEATASATDFAFMANALRALRFRVEAWNPSQGPRPALREAQHRVWIILPPLERREMEPDAAESAVLDAATKLLQDEQPVFILTSPSVSASLGLGDPWASLVQFAGLQAKTNEMVVQLLARSETSNQLIHALEQVDRASHPLAHLIRGRVLWPAPIPLALHPINGWNAEAVVEVPPSPATWIEDDPRVISRGVQQVPPEKVMKPDAHVSLLAVSEKDSWRVAISGGSAWPMTGSAALVDARGMLRFPGNRDLFVGTVRWLAHDSSLAAIHASSPQSESDHGFAVVWVPVLCMVVSRMAIAAARRRA